MRCSTRLAPLLRASCLLPFLVAVPLWPRAADASRIAHVAAPAEPREQRLELDVGMLIGGTDVGDVVGPSVGVVAAGGMRLGDLWLLGELNYLTIGDGDRAADPRRGRQTRLGLLARYSLVSVGSRRSPLRGDFWLEGGVGRQLIAWREGGRLDRNDVAVGFGLQMNGRIGRRGPSPRHFGPYFAFRAHIAQAPVDRSMPPTCGGPCDRATRPSRADVSLFFHTGLNFGR